MNDCPCGCHRKSETYGNPDGCEYCIVRHMNVRPLDPSSGNGNGGAAAPPGLNPDQFKALCERLVQEAKADLGPLGVCIVMVGDFYGNARVMWSGPLMTVLGLKDMCNGLIDDITKKTIRG